MSHPVLEFCSCNEFSTFKRKRNKKTMGSLYNFFENEEYQTVSESEALFSVFKSLVPECEQVALENIAHMNIFFVRNDCTSTDSGRKYTRVFSFVDGESNLYFYLEI